MPKAKDKAEVHVFIDTSTFLTFYAFANDDIEELKKVVGLINNDKLKLYIPQQVVEEFQRNREKKIAESLDLFKKASVPKSLPRFMSGYDEAKEFTKAAKELEKVRSALIERAKTEALQNDLAADALFSQIVEAATTLEVSKKILVAANRRRMMGNPPGKKDSLAIKSIGRRCWSMCLTIQSFISWRWMVTIDLHWMTNAPMNIWLLNGRLKTVGNCVSIKN